MLIEILEALFAELERQLPGWFGKKRRSREVIVQIRRELQERREKADQRETEIREAETTEGRDTGKAEIALGERALSIKASDELSESGKRETERRYKSSS